MSRLHAILIAGNEPKFIDGMGAFYNYAIDLVRVPPGQITTITFPQSKEHLLESTKEAACKAKDSPVCVLYDGHGLKGAITPGNFEVPYEELVNVLGRNQSIFINTACYSGSCIPEFESQGLLKNSMILAASHSHEEARGDWFMGELIGTYFNRRKFKSKALYKEEVSQTSSLTI